MEVWGGDGRLTAGHLAALRRWAAAGLLITLMEQDNGRAAATGKARRRWVGCGGASGTRRWLAGFSPPPPPVADLWWPATCTRLEPLPAIDPIAAEIGVPMGAELARRRAALRSINSVYGPGHFYSLGPRRSDPDGLPGAAHRHAAADHATRRRPTAGCHRLARRQSRTASCRVYRSGDAARVPFSRLHVSYRRPASRRAWFRSAMPSRDLGIRRWEAISTPRCRGRVTAR